MNRALVIPSPGAPSKSGWPFRKFRARGGRGIKQVPGEMNGTERRYAAHLDALCRAGSVEWFGFQACKLRLSDALFYTPDFVVLLSDGWIEFVEVKGTRKNTGGERVYYAEPQDVVRIKAAAEILPFRFSIVWALPGGTWGRKDFFETESPQETGASRSPSLPRAESAPRVEPAPLFAMGGAK